MSVKEFVEYLRVLQKRWWLFLIVCGATLGSLLITFQAGPPQYEATLRFLVNAPPSVDVTLYPGFDRPTQSQQIATTQAAFIEVVKSPTVIWKAADALQIPIRLDEAGRRITVEQPMESQFVWLSVRAQDPQEAADLANTLMDTAKQHYGQLMAEPSALAREFISLQVQTAFQDLEAAKQALADFKRDHQVGDLQAEIASQRTIVWNLILGRDEARVTRKAEQVLSYDQIIAQHQAELQRMIALSDEFADLEDKIKRAEADYDFLVGKETEAELKENEVLRAGFIQVVEPAYPPPEPVSSFDVKIFALGGVVSVVVSVVVAFVLEYVESQRRSQSVQEQASVVAS